MMVKISAKDVAFLDRTINSLVNNMYMQKTASRYTGSDILSTVLNTAGVLGLGGMALNAASSIYNGIKNRLDSNMSYKAMFDEFPELKDANRQQVDKYWTVLRDYSPELTRNPLVAGQFVSNMMQYGMRGIDHNTIGQLASIHNDLNRDASNNITMLGNMANNIIKEDYKGMIMDQGRD